MRIGDSQLLFLVACCPYVRRVCDGLGHRTLAHSCARWRDPHRTDLPKLRPPTIPSSVATKRLAWLQLPAGRSGRLDHGYRGYRCRPDLE